MMTNKENLIEHPEAMRVLAPFDEKLLKGAHWLPEIPFGIIVFSMSRAREALGALQEAEGPKWSLLLWPFLAHHAGNITIAAQIERSNPLEISKDINALDFSAEELENSLVKSYVKGPIKLPLGMIQLDGAHKACLASAILATPHQLPLE